MLYCPLGSSNYHGEVVFDCVPSCGTIEPGKGQEFTVRFTADHPSECYADELGIEINNTLTEKVRLRARASKHIMYLQGWDEFVPSEESLCEIVAEEDEGKRYCLVIANSCLLTTQSEKLRVAIVWNTN